MNRKWISLVGVMLAFSLLAAACGDSGGSNSAAETSGNDAAADDSGGAGQGCSTVNDVSLQLQWVTQSQFAGYYAAKDKGFYSDFCLNVTIVEGGVDIVPQQQLASGAVDYAVSWVPKALVSREEGLKIVDVAQVFQRSGTLQVSFADKGINGPADLAGKKVGSWGFGNEFEMLAGMRRNGVEPGVDNEIVQQSFDMLALISGDIDAAQAMRYNEYAQVLETVNPATGELFQPSDLSIIDWNDVGTAMLQDAIWADESRLSDAEYADQTTRFVAASIQGWAFCREAASDCVDIVLSNSPVLGKSHMTWQLNEINKLIWPSPNGAGVMDQGLWDQTVDVATSEGILSAAPDSGAFTNEYATAAIDLLRAKGIDAFGLSWQPTEVTLNPGGE